MVDAGSAVINDNGWREAPVLLSRLERALGATSAASLAPAAAEVRADWVREGAVVLLGTLAKHLPEGAWKL